MYSLSAVISANTMMSFSLFNVAHSVRFTERNTQQKKKKERGGGEGGEKKHINKFDICRSWNPFERVKKKIISISYVSFFL